MSARPLFNQGAVGAGTLATIVSLIACSGGVTDRSPGGMADTALRARADSAATLRCASDPSITVPAGFCATVFADSVGGPRHIVIAPNGDVFVQLMTKKGAAAGGILALRDTNHDGRADTSVYFGDLGGTGIGLSGGYLYADAKDRIVRYQLPAGALLPATPAEIIVSGLPTGGHESRNFVIDAAGTMYLNIGSRTNSCQQKDRTKESPGVDPCVELETRAGVWKFDGRTANQQFGPAARFATGIRNAMGLTINPADGKVYTTQHGRDQFFENWPALFDTKYSAENPAEEFMQVSQGDDFGWPYCYVDVTAKALVTAPEYGGDGRKNERCAGKKAPLVMFPGHWAPMSALFYSGSQFPDHYRGGVFIAFHGSWNRAPEPQDGYRVSFVPVTGGVPSSQYETFADGFAGATKQPDAAAHRPTGLAVAPDGSLFVTDDKGGRIWRISYIGK